MWLWSVGAIVWHFQRGQVQNIFANLILATLASFATYGRFRLSPSLEQSLTPSRKK
jgi:hypothetical protein